MRRTRFVILLILIVAGVFAWRQFNLGPLAFAGGSTVALADYKDANPTGVPATLASADAVKRGEYLARAADCLVCHTQPGSQAYAGGLAIPLPFGTLYTTNITPDKETGIGDYSDQDFLNAVQRGIRKDGTRLYPAMPYPSYTFMTDADALAIKAYLFSLAPVRSANRENTLTFPYNQRWSMAIWSLVFNADARFAPNTSQSPEWNRGAYIAEALAHCGECHTPRNLAFALDNRKKFAGAVTAGWRAYDITSDKGTGIGAWSDDEVLAYLSRGHAMGRGTAAGPMGEAVDESLGHLKPSDISALVTYLRSVASVASADLPEPRSNPAAPSPAGSLAANVDLRGETVYEGACAGCHGWTGISPVIPFATLTGTRGVNDPTANNVAQVIIRGGQRHTGIEAANMPAFGATYSDAEVASVANYVTARFGAKGSDLSVAQVAKLRTQD